MRNRLFTSLALAALLSPAAALADYEGNITVTLPPGAPMTEMKGEIHFKKGKMRMDYTEPMQMGIIHDISGKKTLQVFPKTQTYSEMDLSKSAGGASAQQFPTCKDSSNADKCFEEMGFKKEGTEKANGFDCNVYAKDQDSNGKTIHVKMWRPAKAKEVVFVRQSMSGKDPQTGKDFSMQINITDLKEKTQPDALFTVPADYKKSQGFGAGGGTAGGGARPTPEQIEEMKKRMMEMQKQQGQ